METSFPLLTNLYHAEALENIFWVEYAPRNSDQDATLKTYLASNINFEAFKTASLVQDYGFHVYFEPATFVVWLFGFSGEISHDIGTLLPDHHATSSGSLRASDLGMLEAVPQMSKTPGLKLDPSSPDVANGQRNTPHGQQWAKIYWRAMKAFEYTCCHFLARELPWMQTGMSDCVKQVDQDPLNMTCRIPRSNTATFESRWRVGGRLTVLCKGSRARAFTTLHRRLLEGDHPKPQEVYVLGPFGAFAQYRGVLDNDDDLELREILTKSFSGLGLPIPANVPWVWFSISKSRGPKWAPQDVSQQSAPLLWPANLALHRSSETLGEDLMYSDAVSRGLDHVSQVEQWYFGKEARAATIQRFKKTETQTRQVTQQAPELSDNVEADDGSSPASPPAPVQDAAGIYPTPSDGFGSQALETDQYETPLDGAGVDTITALQANRGHRQNSIPGTDEDMDLFGANDLTEADFNFFDEREAEDPKEAQSTRSAAQASIENVSSSPAPTNCAKEQSLQIAFDSEGGPKHGAKGAVGSASAINATETLNVAKEPHISRNKSPDQDIPESSQHIQTRKRPVDGPIEPPNLRSSSLDTANEIRGSYRNILLSAASFQDKYGARGRYAFDLAELQSPQKALRRDEGGQRLLEGSGLRSAALSSSDSEDESDATEHVCGSTKAAVNDSSHGMTSVDSEPSQENSSENTKISTPITGSASVKPGQDVPQVDKRDHTKSRPAKVPFTSKDRTFIQVAQLVADQAATCTSHTDDQEQAKSGGESSVVSLNYKSVDSAILRALPLMTRLDLTSMVNLELHGLRTSPSSIIHVEAPYVSIERNGTPVDMGQSAITFWEELGLGPASKPKEVRAVCIYPDRADLSSPVNTFLDEMGSVYSSCNFGEHELVPTLEGLPPGHFRLKTNENSGQYLWQDGEPTIPSLAQHLASLPQHSSNTVVYVVNAGNGNESLPFICNMFMYLFEAYRFALNVANTCRCNDLVLQVVPLAMVVNEHHFALPSPNEYRRLALELYDRCAPSKTVDDGEPPPPYATAPAIRISPSLPRALDFKMTANPTGILSIGRQGLHLAYKWHPTSRWLSASWTDDNGSRQWNGAYWLGDAEDKRRLFASVAIEIWDTSLEISKPSTSGLMLSITKDGPFENFENTAWVSIRSRSSVAVSLTLLTIDTSPALDLSPSTNAELLDQNIGPPSTTTSTPQSAAVSPEVSTNVVTPGTTALPFESDKSAKLIDITDESWSVVLAPDVAQLLRRYPGNRRAPSGLLIKRAGPSPVDGVVRMQVDFGYGNSNLSQVMKVTLDKFRNLSLLARLRNITHPVLGILPIHVAAVRSIHEAVSNNMVFEGD